MGFISNISKNAKTSLYRFPVVVLWAVFGSIFLISIFGLEDRIDTDKYEDVSLVLILGISWFIGCQFLSETLKHNTLSRFVFKALVLSGLVSFYFYLNQFEDDIPAQAYQQWGLLLLSGHLFVAFAPFVFLWHKSLFWNYLKSVIISLLRSGIYAIVLYLGLALAISALEFLFDVDFNHNIYLQIFIFCLGIVNTFVYLHDFPKVSELDKSVDFKKPIEVLILYILIPLSLLYMLIVYTYAFKILIEWELPRGWVTYLISGLSILAFAIHISIDPVREKHESKLIQKFFPFYFYAILPLLPLLFIALYKRIIDYNFTELRYLGLVLAVWITGMLLYMLFSSKKSLSLYAKSMFILVLLCTFGPLSAYKVSMSAQLNELGEIMDNLKTKTEKAFSQEDFSRFSSIVRYIAARQNLNQTEAYFGFNPKEKFAEVSDYNISRKITEELGIEITKDYNTNNFHYYTMSNFENDFAEEITDYTNFTILNIDKSVDASKAIQLHFNENGILSFRNYGEVLMETDMTSHLKAMDEKYDYISKAKHDEFTFRFKNDKGDFLLIFNHFSFRIMENKIESSNGRAMVFYRTYKSLELP